MPAGINLEALWDQNRCQDHFRCRTTLDDTHTKNEPGLWVQKAFKHVQIVYAQCCDAAQAKPALSRSGLTVIPSFGQQLYISSLKYLN